MATSTRPRGRKRPVSSAGKRGLGRVAANAKRGWSRTVRKHPMVGVVASIVLALAAVVSLLLGVILESVLYYLVTAMAGLGALAIRRAQQMQQHRHGPPPKARPSSSGPRAAKPSGGSRKAKGEKGSGPIKCTQTGRPIEECDCRSRHVSSQEGVEQFGRPLGSPIGRKKKQQRPSSTV